MGVAKQTDGSPFGGRRNDEEVDVKILFGETDAQCVPTKSTLDLNSELLFYKTCQFLPIIKGPLKKQAGCRCGMVGWNLGRALK